jgi:VanZ family protein
MPHRSPSRRAHPAPAHVPSLRPLTALVWLLLGLIAYGSLYPFAWDFARPQPFIVRGPVGRIDLIENIVLFVPLGCALAWLARQRAASVSRCLAWAVASLVFAAALQWLQRYLPRTPAASDVAFNALGYALGWVLGHASHAMLQQTLARHSGWRQLDRTALLLVLLWLVAEWFPLIPALDVSTVWANVKSLWTHNPWQPRRMLVHAGMACIGLHAVAAVLTSVRGQRPGPWLPMLVAGLVVAGKFLMLGQAPGAAVPAGIALGVLLWLVCRQLWHGSGGVWMVALATYLLEALAPYALSDVARPMEWIPFASSLRTGVATVLSSVAFEVLCFVAVLWAVARRGLVLSWAAAALALLALACEWLQQYLPGRTPEVTSVVTALLSGAVVAGLGVGRTSGQAHARSARR